MPINDIVAEYADRAGTTPIQSGGAPQADGRPERETAATTMRTGPLLPPWIHNQTLNERSALALLGTVLGFIGLYRQVKG